MSTNYKNRSKNNNRAYEQPTSKIDEEPKFETTDVSSEIKESVTIPEETKVVDTEKTPAPSIPTRKVVVIANKLNVRDTPTIPSGVITMVSKKDVLITADSLNKEWITVTTKAGLTGYVMSRFVE